VRPLFNSTNIKYTSIRSNFVNGILDQTKQKIVCPCFFLECLLLVCRISEIVNWSHLMTRVSRWQIPMSKMNKCIYIYIHIYVYVYVYMCIDVYIYIYMYM